MPYIFSNSLNIKEINWCYWNLITSHPHRLNKRTSPKVTSHINNYYKREAGLLNIDYRINCNHCHIVKHNHWRNENKYNVSSGNKRTTRNATDGTLYLKKEETKPKQLWLTTTLMMTMIMDSRSLIVLVVGFIFFLVSCGLRFVHLQTMWR